MVTQRLKLANELKLIPISESSVQIPSENTIWKSIDRFAWDQTESEVKIYVTSFEGFKNHPKEKVLLENTNNSLTVSIRDFKDTNYKLIFTRFTKSIASARITLKSNGFSITLQKKDKGHWDTLVPKASAAKKNEEEEEKVEGKDPGDGLMNMMKELYENGDDDMKRTIAEAWTKSKDKNN